MADRKSLFSRFWPPASTRRTSTTETAAPPPATATAAAPPPRPARQPTTKASTSTSPPAPTTPPRPQPRKASQQTATPSTKDEPKSSPPSRATARSPSSSKPATASPSRSSAQSRSPPQPSQTPSSPKRPSKPPSPSRVASRSPKQGSSSSPTGKLPASPSYEAPTLASKEKDSKPATPQPEPEMKEVNGPNRDDNVEAKHSQSSELAPAATPAQEGEAIKSLDSSSVNAEHESKDEKEVVQETTTETNEEKKKEVVDSSAPKSVLEPEIVEKAVTPGEEEEQIQREKQEGVETKEIIATPAAAPSGDQDRSAPANGEQDQLKKDIKANMGDPKTAISDRPVSVITLAGENRGASMQMESDSSKREKPIHIHRSYKINPDESPEAITEDPEKTSEGNKQGDERCAEDQLMEAYVNNNAQGINNSIVFNSSIVEGNPGVHMVVNHLPREPVKLTSRPETRKSEVNMSRAEKLTYQPTVRRRCLRGLLLETSDSDPENPAKPRSHGCRVGCQKGDRENSIDVV